MAGDDVEGTGAGNLDLDDDETGVAVRSTKKAEMKQKKAII